MYASQATAIINRIDTHHTKAVLKKPNRARVSAAENIREPRDSTIRVIRSGGGTGNKDSIIDYGIPLATP